jgi:hypothetical protein
MLGQLEELRSLGEEETGRCQQVELDSGRFDVTMILLLIDLAQIMDPVALPHLNAAVHGLGMDVEHDPLW